MENKSRIRLFIAFVVCLLTLSYTAKANTLTNIKLINKNDSQRLVFYLQNVPKYSLKKVNGKLELRILDASVKDATFNTFKAQYKFNDISLLRKKQQQKNIAIFYLNVSQQVKRHFFMNPNQYTKEYRLIIDIEKPKQHPSLQKLTTPAKQDANNLSNTLSELDKKIANITQETINNSDYNDLDSIVKQTLASNNNNIETLLDEIIDFKLLESEIKQEQLQEKRDDFENDIFRFLQQKVNTSRDNLNTKTVKTLIKKNIYTIVIDAGHGGKDPGTHGLYKKTKEKNINLAYAIALYKQLSQNKKLKVYLVRNKDIYLTLSERLQIARKYKPDLFISLHTDFSPNKKTRGVTFYTLSKTASDIRTAKLASSENKTNIIAGLNLCNEYQDTINTLVDLSRKDILNESSKITDFMIKNFKRHQINLLSSPHKHGNFAILLAPDFPSILIELGFLSNMQDEKILITDRHKSQIAKAIAESINKYFSSNK